MAAAAVEDQALRDRAGALAAADFATEVLAALEELINERTVSGSRYNAQANSEVDTEVFA